MGTTSPSSAFLQFGVVTEGEPEGTSEAALLPNEEKSVKALEDAVKALEDTGGNSEEKGSAAKNKLAAARELLNTVKKNLAEKEAALLVHFERIKALIQAYKRLAEVPFQNMEDPKTVTALLNAYEVKGR